MKKVLVTGASGFIGNYVINELLKRKCEVVATSASPAKAAACSWFSQVKYIPLDFKNLDDAENYFDFFHRPDLLVHLAWEGLPNYKAEFHLQENLPRHELFLHNLISHGLNDVAVTGTCFEYGKQEGMLSEELPTAPDNAYAQAKDGLRIYLQNHKGLATWRWIRLFYMYGKGQSPNSLLSQLERAIANGDAVFNMSPGDQLRDYLPVEAVAKGIVSISLQQQVTGIINCCSGEPITVSALVESHLKQWSASIKLNKGFYPYNDLEPRNFWGDNSKLKNILSNE